MYSGTSTSALPLAGFPIRRSRGQRLVSTSPGLIAAAHVLLRLLAPRHPPCALSLLIHWKNSYIAAMEFSRCARAPMLAPRENAGARAGLSKLNSETSSTLSSDNSAEVDVDLGEPDTGRKGSSIRRLWQRPRSKCS